MFLLTSVSAAFLFRRPSTMAVTNRHRAVLFDVPSEAKLADVDYYCEPFGQIVGSGWVGRAKKHALVEFKNPAQLQSFLDYANKFTMFKKPVKIGVFEESQAPVATRKAASVTERAARDPTETSVIPAKQRKEKKAAKPLAVRTVAVPLARHRAVLFDVPSEAKLADVDYYCEPFGQIVGSEWVGRAKKHALVEFKNPAQLQSFLDYATKFTMFKKPVKIGLFEERPNRASSKALSTATAVDASPQFTKADLAKLPLAQHTGRIHLIEEVSSAVAACKVLAKASILGFDTEWRPNFKPNTPQNKIALVQLSDGVDTYLFRICKMGFKLPKELQDILSSSSITKVGVGLGSDNHQLKAVCGPSFTTGGMVDLAQMASKLGLPQRGLRNLAGVILELRVSKAAQVTNWEAKVLTEKQVQYAALDASISLQLFKAMKMRLKAQ